jgi:hypothetical protein
MSERLLTSLTCVADPDLVDQLLVMTTTPAVKLQVGSMCQLLALELLAAGRFMGTYAGMGMYGHPSPAGALVHLQ